VGKINLYEEYPPLTGFFAGRSFGTLAFSVLVAMMMNSPLMSNSRER
jgi:hypothetical protein